MVVKKLVSMFPLIAWTQLTSVFLYYLDALETYNTCRQALPNLQSFEQLRDTARNTRDLIKQRATHYIDCYRVER